MPPRETAEPADKTQASKRDIDWESICRHYRAGILSIRAIASGHGISDAAIRKRAKAEGWQRDLTDQVREAVRSKLVRTPVLAANANPEQIIDEASNIGVTVVREHRTDINKGRKLVHALMEQLEDSTFNNPDIEDAIEDETKDDKTTERRARMMKAVSLSSRSAVIYSLSGSLKNLIALERQAFSLDDPKSPEGNDGEVHSKAQQIVDALREINETTGRKE